jgi:hypothetical protein
MNAARPPASAGAAVASDAPRGERYTHRAVRRVALAVEPAAAFAILDDPFRVAGHMRRRSWRTGFSRLAIVELPPDALGRPRYGWRGRVFGLPIAIDEVVTARDPPRLKAWETIGSPRMWVIDQYRIEFRVEATATGCVVELSIDYTLPERGVGRFLGPALGHAYQRWCLDRMVGDLVADRPPAATP